MKKQLKRFVHLGLVLVLVLAALAGCGTATEQRPSPEAQSSPGISAQPQAAYPCTITDHLGREVTIEKEPERLVSGYYITTSLLIALEQSDKLVGVEAKAERFAVYALSAPQILDLPNVGSAKEFDLEGCAALSPDLVILPVKLKDAIESLEGLGIAAIGVEPEDRQRLFETIEMVGAATGSRQRAEALKNHIQSKYDELETLTQGLEKPRVYFAGNSSYLNTAGEKMYQNSLVEAAGAENVAAGIADSYWVEVSYEQLLAWDPDVIVVAPGAEYTVEELKADAALAGLQAIEENRVYRMPSQVEFWDAPVPSSVLGSLWLAGQLHPQAYGQEEFAADFSAFYNGFYGADIRFDSGAKGE